MRRSPILDSPGRSATEDEPRESLLHQAPYPESRKGSTERRRDSFDRKIGKMDRECDLTELRERPGHDVLQSGLPPTLTK
jgi:hypothetical protein